MPTRSVDSSASSTPSSSMASTRWSRLRMRWFSVAFRRIDLSIINRLTIDARKDIQLLLPLSIPRRLSVHLAADGQRRQAVTPMLPKSAQPIRVLSLERAKATPPSWSPSAALRAVHRHEPLEICAKRPVASFLASDCSFSRQSCSFSRTAQHQPPPPPSHQRQKMKIQWIRAP